MKGEGDMLSSRMNDDVPPVPARSPAPAVRLRAARRNDLPGIRRLLDSANETRWDLSLVADEKCFGDGLSGPPRCLLAIDGHQLVGLAVACGPFLRLLAVRPDRRREGIGTLLLRAVERAAVARGETTLTAGAEPGNYFVPGVPEADAGSLEFFRSLGWKECGTNLNLVTSLPITGVVAAPHPSVRIRRPLAAERTRMLAVVEAEFGSAWALETGRAFEPSVPSIFVAEQDGAIVGFSAHDANNRGLGWFGPEGVLPPWRGQGIGRQLLLASLQDLFDSWISRGGDPVDLVGRVLSAQLRSGDGRQVRPVLQRTGHSGADPMKKEQTERGGNFGFRSRATVRKLGRRMVRDERRRGFLPLALGMSGGVILATAAFWFFREEAERVVTGKADAYDTKVLHAVRATSSPAMDRAMQAVTQLGSHVAIGTTAFVAAMSMRGRNRSSDAWTVLISTGGAMVLNTTLKAIFQRQRPQELYRHIKLPKSHSFPSGHSLLSAATYPIAAHHLVQRRSTTTQALVQGAALGAILSVGYSRIYFGVHFPSDVLGGFAAGFGWLGLTSLSHTFMDRRMTRRLPKT